MLKKGLSHTSETKVTTENTAKKYGSGGLDVFATPAMIGLMENAAMSAVKNELSDNNTTVGSMINTTHIKPSALGSIIHATAILKKIKDRKLTFKVSAYDDNGLIGEGIHIRYIVDQKRFMAKLNKK